MYSRVERSVTCNVPQATEVLAFPAPLTCTSVISVISYHVCLVLCPCTLQQLASESQRLESEQAGRRRLEGLMDSSLKSADASRGELEERLRALTASEATLTQQLQATKGRLQQVGTGRGVLQGRWQGRASGPSPSCRYGLLY